MYRTRKRVELFWKNLTPDFGPAVLAPVAYLLKTQRNQVLKRIVDSGHNPTDFAWADSLGDVLRYVGSGGEEHFFEFTFEVSRGRCSFRPGRAASEEAIDHLPFAAMLGHVDTWLNCLKRELEAPDLWADLAQLEAVVRANASSEEESEDDEERTQSDRKRLAEAFRKTKKLVERTFDPADEQRGAILDTLKRIETSSERVGPKDLIVMVLGHVAGVVIAGTLTLQNGQWLLAQLLNALVSARILLDGAAKALTS